MTNTVTQQCHWCLSSDGQYVYKPKPRSAAKSDEAKNDNTKKDAGKKAEKPKS